MQLPKELHSVADRGTDPSLPFLGIDVPYDSRGRRFITHLATFYPRGPGLPYWHVFPLIGIERVERGNQAGGAVWAVRGGECTP